MKPRFNIFLEEVDFADFEELVEIRSAAMRESLDAVGRFNPERVAQRLAENFDPDNSQFIVIDEQRLGFLTLVNTEQALLLQHFYLLPQAQNRGIGGQILQSICGQADTAGVLLKTTALVGSRANQFYQRHGFIAAGDDNFDIYYVRQPQLLKL